MFCVGGNGKKVETSYEVAFAYEGTAAQIDEESAVPDAFIIDEVAPLIVMNFRNESAMIEPGTQELSPAYSLTPVTARINILEGNFDQADVSVTVTSKDADGKEIDAYPEASINAVKTSEWEQKNESYIFEMDPFSEDANYSFSIEYTDPAGNKAKTYATRFFTVDKSAPEGRILVKTSDGEVKEYWRVLEEKELEEKKFPFVFDLFDKKVILQKDIKEETSGIDKVEYCLIDVDSTAGKGFVQPADMDTIEWVEWIDEETQEGEEEKIPEIVIDTDRILVIFEKITDKAGNVTYISSSGALIVDTKDLNAPQITVTGAESSIYNNDLTIKIEAVDPDNGEGVFSGMKKITYEVINNASGERTQEGEFSADGPRERSLSGNIEINARNTNSNDVTLKLTAEDFAGNVSETEKALAFDTTAPEISVSFSAEDAKNGHYFNHTKEMTVSFRERNYSAKLSKLMVTTGGQSYVYTMADLVAGKGKGFGITVKSGSDTQKGKSTAAFTDDRVNTYTLLFGDGNAIDRDYSNITFTCDDTCNNHGDYRFTAFSVFTVDKVSPQLTVAFASGGKTVTEKIGTNGSAPYYTQTAVTPSITVKERNFASKGIDITLSQKDADGNDVSAYDPANIDGVKKGSWETSGDTHTRQMAAFSEDANYGMSMVFTDLAGNTATYVPHFFTVDATAPEGTITVSSGDGSGTYTGYSGSTTFTFMDNAPIAVARTARDNTSGVASVSYYRYVPGAFASGTFAGLTRQQLSKVKWEAWSEDLTVDPDSQAVVYARIIDRAGNITYISTEGAMIADRTNPAAPNINITAGTPAGGIYNGDVPVSVSVEDVLFGGTFSGLKSVTIDVLRDGTVTQSYSKDFEPKAARQKTYATDFTIDASRNNSNNVTIQVTAEDYAGNRSGMEQNLSIDTTDPRIEVTYDRNDPVNGRYYDSARTATIRVYERNFDPGRVSFDISGNPRITGWDVSGGSDDSVSICTIIYDTDDDYSFTMSLTDLAGNSASYGQTDQFTIDTTDPVINLSFSGGAGNGRYYNTDRTANITVVDRNFDESFFSAAVRASLQDLDISAPGVIGWSHNGNEHYATISFTGDGDYDFTLDFTDLAGNRAERYVQSVFTIDQTAPEVEFYDVEEGSANSGEAAPGVRYYDLHLEEGSFRLRLLGLKHREKDVTGQFTAMLNGGAVKLSDFAHTIEEDDVYILIATVSDLAGNRTEKKLNFSVNRFGSNYYFSDETTKYLGRVYNKSGKDVVLYEVNVNSLQANGITIYKDGVLIKIPAGAYKVEDISEENDWKKYRYTIDASMFDEEGVYEVLINSTDEAGNRQDNKLGQAPISFVIDKTAPSAVITGAENGGIYDGAARDLIVSVTDNFAMGTLKILVNGETIAEFDAEKIGKLEGKLPFTITEGEGWQEISLVFEDAAGNEGTIEPMRLLLTTNWLTRFLYQGYLKFLLIPGAGLLAFILFLIAKRKKDEEKEGKA